MADEVKNEATEAADAAASTDAKAKKVKNGKKKWPIVVGIVAVVIVAAGAGFFVWHEQPSFCNAICHTPMDAYYETYANGNQDKWGNDLDDTAKQGMMAYVHAAYDKDGNQVDQGKGINCLACHVPTMSEQITEGLNWVTGNYEVSGTNAKGQTIPTERELADLVEARGIAEDEFCLNSGCHHVTADGKEIASRDDLIAATADLDPEYNPHQPQHGEYACSQCHKAHSQSVNYCTQCHSTAPVPDGWLTSAEAKKLHAIA